MGRSRPNPWGDLDQMWRVGRYGECNHVCNILWLSVKGCGCGGRGKFALSHLLEVSPLQHWSHYCVHDRVIVAEWMLYGVEIVLNMERDDSFFGSGGLTFIVELNHYRS